jgi:hypothetical protein
MQIKKKKVYQGMKKEESACENKQQNAPRSQRCLISIQRDKTNKTFTSKTTF